MNKTLLLVILSVGIVCTSWRQVLIKEKCQGDSIQPATLTGLRYKSLDTNKRNIIKDTIYLKKWDWKSQFRSPNTIYKVKYSVNLAGDTLQIPRNSKLIFIGGRFYNGTVVGNHTKIEGGTTYSLCDNINLEGTWGGSCFPEWFGAVGDGVTDDTDAIQKSFDLFDKVFFNNATYLVKADKNDGIITDHTDEGACALIAHHDLSISGDNATIKLYHTDREYKKSKNYYAIVSKGSLDISGITIDGQYSTYRGTYGIQLRASGNRVSRCTFKNLGSSGLVFNGAYANHIANNNVKDVSLENCGNSIFCVFVDNSSFENISMRRVSEGFDFDKLCSNIKVSNILFDGLRGKGADAAVEINGGKDFIIEDCDINGAKIGILINGKPRKDRVGLPVDTKSYDIIVRRCVIRNTVSYGVTLGSTYYAEHNSYDQKDILFEDVNVYNTGLQGFHLTGEDIRVINCSATDCNKAAFFINNYHKGIKIEGFKNECKRLSIEKLDSEIMITDFQADQMSTDS